VAADHLLRSNGRFVELSETGRELASFYRTIGQPSVDPKLMVRRLLIALLRNSLRMALVQQGSYWSLASLDVSKHFAAVAVGCDRLRNMAKRSILWM
jgi:hypothetical protein